MCWHDERALPAHPVAQGPAPLAGENTIRETSWWGTFPIDSVRLTKYFGWAEKIDTRFFDNRTTIILGGDDPDMNGPTGPASTVGGVIIDGPEVMRVDRDFGILGDRTFPHSYAILEGVPTYIAPGIEHSMLPSYSKVIDAVDAVLAGNTPSLARVPSDDPTAYAQPRPLPTRRLARRRASTPTIPSRKVAQPRGVCLRSNTDQRVFAGPRELLHLRALTCHRDAERRASRR